MPEPRYAKRGFDASERIPLGKIPAMRAWNPRDRMAVAPLLLRCPTQADQIFDLN
jgi:hypothetical protein